MLRPFSTRLFLFIALLTPAAHAQTTTDQGSAMTAHGTPVPEAARVACQQCFAVMSQQPSQWTLTFSPAYVHKNRDNADTAFTANGFSKPRQDFFGYQLQLKKQLPSRFQWGVEFLAAETNREQGTNQANYRTGLFGLYLGYRALERGRFSIDVGSGLGGAGTSLEVFSGTQNGRLRENAWYAQPTIGFAYTVSQYLRLGLSASYIAPFGQNEDVVGQDLGVRDLALQGFSGKIDLILGRF